MIYNKQTVIDLAISQVGYHEKSSNAQLDTPGANSGSANWTKFARDLDAMPNFYNGPKNGFAWCDVFVDWCFVTAYGRDAAQFLLCQPNGSAGAGCLYSAQYFQAKGQFYTSPQTGDQIFFGSSADVYHTGLVVEIGGGYVTTVEGNSADRVQKCRYAIGASNIYGYGRPAWNANGPQAAPEEPDSPGDPIVPPEAPETPTGADSTCRVDLPVLMIGDDGGYVRTAQTLLIALGYDCGNKPLLGVEKADGEFGRMTEKSVGLFQAKRGLEVDGIIGGETWTALLKM